MSFPRYESYKHSGIEWLGEVPEHWEVLKVRRIAVSVETGGTPSSESPSTYLEDGVVWYTPGDFGDALHLTYSARKITKEIVASGEAKLFPANSVLVVSIGATLGKVGYIEQPASANQQINAIIPNDLIDGYFLTYSLFVKTEVMRFLSNASTIGIMNQEKTKEIWLAVPKLEEQSVITTFLDRETAKIDALIAEQQRLIELLKEKRLAVISHAVTKGLNPDAPMKDSGIEWLGEVPEHWEPVRIKHLFRQAKRQGYPDHIVLSVYREYGVVEKDSRDDNNNKTPEDLSSYQLVECGDLVVNKMKAWQGSLGVSSFEGITSPDYMVYTSIHNQVPEYLHYMLRQRNLVGTYKAISSGIRPQQWRLEPDKFGQLLFFLPPRPEQEKILTFVSDQQNQLEFLAMETEQAITLLQERRTALISAAVTGKIDVRGLVKAQPEREAAA